MAPAWASCLTQDRHRKTAEGLLEHFRRCSTLTVACSCFTGGTTICLTSRKIHRPLCPHFLVFVHTFVWLCVLLIHFRTRLSVTSNLPDCRIIYLPLAIPAGASDSDHLFPRPCRWTNFEKKIHELPNWTPDTISKLTTRYKLMVQIVGDVAGSPEGFV